MKLLKIGHTKVVASLNRTDEGWDCTAYIAKPLISISFKGYKNKAESEITRIAREEIKRLKKNDELS